MRFQANSALALSFRLARAFFSCPRLSSTQGALQPAFQPPSVLCLRPLLSRALSLPFPAFLSSLSFVYSPCFHRGFAIYPPSSPPSSVALHLNSTSDDPLNADLTSDSNSDADAENLVAEAEADARRDSDIDDPVFIFREVWNKLKNKFGEERLNFPRDIMFLAGAPGAGKGVMTPVILEYRGIRGRPIEVGALLNSEEARRLKAEGKLVGDRQVIELLLETLLKPEYENGVLVDGFPRSRVQAESIKLLYDEMLQLRRKFSDSPDQFRRPIIHITVLYIDKEESVRRQLQRGRLALAHNQRVKETGVGKLWPVRETDVDARLAEERYKLFQQQVYESLNVVKERFHFHFIDADAGEDEVRSRILNELRYQSSMELADSTFEKIRKIPLASEIILHARTELVRRLDSYLEQQPQLFESVIQVLQNEFVHILKRQALAGAAIIRSQSAIFLQVGAIDMMLDLLSERGFTAVLDYQRETIPVAVNLKTGKLEVAQRKIFEFHIQFPKPTIRRG